MWVEHRGHTQHTEHGMFSINYAIICTIRKETVLGEQGPCVHGTFSLMVTFQKDI